MSKTALLWLLLFFGGLVVSVVHPFWALAAYLLDYYQHPPLRWWGRNFPELRWSLTASVVLLGALFLKGRSPLGRAALRHQGTWWLVGLCVIAVLVTATTAISFDRSVHYLRQLVLLTLLYLMIVATLDDIGRWRSMILIMAIGSFTWGWDSWLDPERVAGRLLNVGGADSLNDNSAALHLLAVVPLLVVMLFYGRRYERIAAIVVTPFVLNTIILCNSRGATVAMVMMMATGLVLARGKVRARLAGLVVAGAVLLLALSDPQFIDRQLTILSTERDGSATGRIEAWKGSLELMIDYPFGAGGGGFDILSYRYIPEIVARAGEERAVHNTYLWIGSDWGFLGLGCYLMFMAHTFLRLQRTRRQLPLGREAMECLAVQASLVGIWTGGFFINRTYGEIMYWMPALAAALTNITMSASGDQPAVGPVEPAAQAAADAATASREKATWGAPLS